MMATKNPTPLFQVGDPVAIRYSDWRARVVEFRGPLAPGGVYVYRVRVPLKPKPTYIELREDQLAALLVPPKIETKPFENHAPDTLGQQEKGPTLPKGTKKSPLFQIGDRVRIRRSDWRGRIIEFRGLPAPGGMFVYCIEIPAKPKPFYIEVPEDELKAIPRGAKQKSNSSAQRRVRDAQKGK
jgi:hypothetical protein